MRLLLPIILITALFGLFAPPARAQTDDSAVFTVADVVADVTADSAAHARDQAIVQAQHTALTQLLQRLGVDPSIGAKLSDDDLATLVQSFEVQSERSSSVRYIGVYTVLFRPMAMRSWLDQQNAAFNATQSPPVVALPVLMVNGQPVLWEDKTKWRAAWEKDAHDKGLVPIIVPAGDANDSAAAATPDIMSGKTEAIKAMIDRYQAAGGAAVVVLDTDLAKPGQALKVTVDRYDSDGDSIQPDTSFTLPAPNDRPAIDIAVLQAIKQVRQQLEKDWRQQGGEQPQTDSSASGEPAPVVIDPQQQAAAEGEPVTHLPVVVLIQTLPEWAHIERRLESTPAVSNVDVIALQRVSTNIDLEFRGSVGALQQALAQQGLALQQDITNHVWTLTEEKP